MKRSHAALTALAVIAGLAIAGCGSSGNSTSSASGSEASGAETASSGGGGAYGRSYGKEESASPTSSTGGSGGEAAPVSVGAAAGVGKVLVDSKGMTLYYFEKDKKGSGESKCDGACAEAWPPLITSGEPEAMSGVDSSMLGTIERSDGTTQVTYASWPLYTFVEDKKPGEDNGTDSKAFGASWYPLHPNGQKAGH
jgi:predicted lipoprotein with Yx(FWY)xxD motif